MSNSTFVNSLNSFCGLNILESSCDRYICAISLPFCIPIFFIVTFGDEVRGSKEQRRRYEADDRGLEPRRAVVVMLSLIHI